VLSALSIEREETEIPEDIVTQRLKELAERRRAICINKMKITGIVITRGDIIKLKIKGRGKDEIDAVFRCFNPWYNWLELETEDDIIVVKLSDIRYIAKSKRKREVSETEKGDQP